MKSEVAAGGVVVTYVDNQWHVLLLQDMNKNWTFPKGIVESGEDTKEAAIREVFEETGVTGLSLVQPLTPIEYVFTRKETVHKKVQYFLFFSPGKQQLTPQTDEGITVAEWIEFSHAFSCIGYQETNVPLLTQAQTVLRTYTIA